MIEFLDHRIVYSSRSVHPLGARQLADLAGEAARINAGAGITGCLLYDGASFLQLLEGPPDAVGSTFARIRRDGRHAAIKVLSEQPIKARSLPYWSMGYRAVRGGSFDDAFMADVMNGVTRLSDTDLRAVFIDPAIP